MRPILIATMALLWMAPNAWSAEVASACAPGANGRVDFQACLDASPVGSPERALSLINLGTQAFAKRDYATAVRHYDEAQPSGGKHIFSDAAFHAFRASAYDHVGRKAEALVQAEASFDILQGRRLQGMPAGAQGADPEVVLPYLLPILKRGNAARFQNALAVYRSIPAKDWVTHANRTGVLTELGDFEGAQTAHAEALKAQPDHPGVLNNGCYLATKRGRAADGLAACEKAVALAPDVAAIRDTYADALSALGRCPEAEAALANARRLDPSSAHYGRRLTCKAR